MEHPLTIFRNRLLKIGIEIEMWSNYPWIYIEKVNGNEIAEEDYFYANHGFTVGFHPIRPGEEFKYTDIKRIFEIIRKYK